MWEIRQSGSEGGVVGNGHPYPYNTSPAPQRRPVGRVPRPGVPGTNPNPNITRSRHLTRKHP